MAVLWAKGKSISTKKSSSSSKASSIGSVVSGNWGVGSTYSNTGNTVADKAVRDSKGISAQGSANEIAAAQASWDKDRLAAANTMTPWYVAPTKWTSWASQNNNRQSTTQPNPTAYGTKPSASDASSEQWNSMTLAQQKLYAKLNPNVDLAAKWWEFAKSNASKIAAQNWAASGKNDAWLWQKPTDWAAPQAPATNSYQDESAERMAEINANLQLAYEQTPWVFKNRELFDAEFDYAKRSQKQKTQLDEFYKRKTNESFLKSISANDIVNSITSGKTSLEKFADLETIDPVKYQAVMDGIQVANNKKKAESNMAVNDATLQSADGKSTELTVPKELTENNAAIEAAINSNADEYKAAVNDPDLMAKRDELTEEMWYVDQLDKDIMRVKDEVAAQYPWVPRSQLNAIIADRTDKYRIERGDALIKINTLQGIINNRLEEAQLNYNVENNRTSQLMSLESQKLQQLGFAFQLKSYEEAPQRAKELAQFQSDLQLQQNQAKMEQEFDFANPDWNSTDPAEQNRALTMAINRAYETFGDIIQRSPAQVIADVKKYAQENWVSMQEALQQNFISQLKDKPEYQKILNTKMWVSNDPSAGMQWGKIWEWTDDNGVVHDTFGLINLNNWTVTPSSFWGWGAWGGWSSQEWMRTDRHNNPTAFTTAIAEQAGLVLWKDYEQWDAFPNNPNLHTARLLWDPIETTIKVIDKIGFFTGAGQPRRTHTAMSNEEWLALDSAGKAAVVADMYRKEWGNGSLIWETNSTQSNTPQTNTSYDPNRMPDYIKYIEKWVMPTGMKDGSVNWQKFKAEAQEWYIAAKEEALKQKWFTITNPEAYLSTDQDTRTNVNKAVEQVPWFIDTMDRLIALTKEQGTEAPRTASALQMKQLVVDAQLKAKEIYNLWVLNWPDLELMQAIIKDPVGFGAKIAANTPLIRRDYAQLLRNAKETILSNAYGKASQVWLSPVMSWAAEDDERNNFLNQNISQWVSSWGGYTLQYSTPFPND